jgi:hypothetical protein
VLQELNNVQTSLVEKKRSIDNHGENIFDSKVCQLHEAPRHPSLVTKRKALKALKPRIY